jgi:hypothetical protein
MYGRIREEEGERQQSLMTVDEWAETPQFCDETPVYPPGKSVRGRVDERQKEWG